MPLMTWVQYSIRLCDLSSLQVFCIAERSINVTAKVFEGVEEHVTCKNVELTVVFVRNLGTVDKGRPARVRGD